MFFELQKKKKKKKEKHQLKLTQKKRINEQTKDRQCEVTFLDSTSQANQSLKKHLSCCRTKAEDGVSSKSN